MHTMYFDRIPSTIIDYVINGEVFGKIITGNWNKLNLYWHEMQQTSSKMQIICFIQLNIDV